MDPRLVYGPLSKPFLYQDLLKPHPMRRARARSRSTLPRSYVDFKRLSATTSAMEAALNGKTLAELKEEKLLADQRVRQARALSRSRPEEPRARPSRLEQCLVHIPPTQLQPRPTILGIAGWHADTASLSRSDLGSRSRSDLSSLSLPRPRRDASLSLPGRPERSSVPRRSERRERPRSLAPDYRVSLSPQPHRLPSPSPAPQLKPSPPRERKPDAAHRPAVTFQDDVDAQASLSLPEPAKEPQAHLATASSQATAKTAQSDSIMEEPRAESLAITSDNLTAEEFKPVSDEPKATKVHKLTVDRDYLVGTEFKPVSDELKPRKVELLTVDRDNLVATEFKPVGAEPPKAPEAEPQPSTLPTPGSTESLAQTPADMEADGEKYSTLDADVKPPKAAVPEGAVEGVSGAAPGQVSAPTKVPSEDVEPVSLANHLSLTQDDQKITGHEAPDDTPPCPAVPEDMEAQEEASTEAELPSSSSSSSTMSPSSSLTSEEMAAIEPLAKTETPVEELRDRGSEFIWTPGGDTFTAPRRSESPAELEAGPEETVTKDGLFLPASFGETWDTRAYLECFYERRIEDPAMQMVMYYLPNFLAPLPRGRRALDFGAGPTVHVAMMLRDKVEEVHLGDFLPQNREELRKWLRGDSAFDWGLVARIINGHEAAPAARAKDIEPATRQRVAGIHHCDMFQRRVLPESSVGDFDVVTTFFCVEYSCLKKEDYRAAIANIWRSIRPGGYFIMGGVMEVTWCAFGGRCFASLYLTQELLFDSLAALGVDVADEDDLRFKFLHNDGMFMIRVRKPHNSLPHRPLSPTQLTAR